ncbi:MAG TPA: MBL fold metallo-hydrolase [Thermodesulfobacteriota bacterium]|nr:MBL fold metallo-hydrolase [Thermodesulfobacteriota bacterium]
MYLEQFYLESLGHASYLIGSHETGEALVFDPRRDVEPYFAAARAQGMRIAYAADSHQHNDYLSGIREIAARGRVALLGSAAGRYGYGPRLLADGERLEMGEVVFEALHTPGHTPEHMSLLVTDRSRGDEPALLLSGGALLVGDVARPDLLGGIEEAKRQAAVLCRTLQSRILTLPDHVLVYPTHVAGSLCGAHIGRRLSTTIGYERRMNRLLASAATQEAFIGRCVELRDLPAVPPYWRRMRRQNAEGPALLGVPAEPPALGAAAFEREMAGGAVVLDCRSPEAFGGGHIPGALNVGLGPPFPTWAGTVLPEGAAVLLVLERPEELWTACWELLRIGYDLPVGWLAGGMHAWRTAGRPLATLPQWTAAELRDRLAADRALLVLDVRQPAEWTAGHIPGAVHLTGAELPARLGEVPADRPVAVVCSSGYRSSVAASLLARAGRRRVASVLGGTGAWQALGYPMVRPEAPAA